MKRSKTPLLKNQDIKRTWHLIDAKEEVFGRLASKTANLLTGKRKVQYSSHQDIGDYVVVLNADKIKVTGAKEKQKKYYRHSWHLGSLKEETFQERHQRAPEKLFWDAVRLMLPKNSLAKAQLKRLKVLKGDKNPYQSHFSKKGSSEVEQSKK
jgi:large subunit ribosomal protein L13